MNCIYIKRPLYSIERSLRGPNDFIGNNSKCYYIPALKLIKMFTTAVFRINIKKIERRKQLCLFQLIPKRVNLKLLRL